MNTLKQNSNTSTKRPLDNARGKQVFVGLSGGVDSAVSAALLKKQGFDVTGVFIKVWQPDFLPCTWREERRDAMRVAIALDIPFLFLDLEKEYKKGVVDKMIAEYKNGRTPNPDVLCNKEVKFGAFALFAKEHGADYIATGHYAQITNNQQLTTDKRILKEGGDKEKDQSYFLWTLTQKDLSHVLFPVGNMKKDEVRKLAKQMKIPVSEKKDSQGICFIGDVSMEEFLSHFIETKSGKVLSTSGNVIGEHSGALLYTIGERHGFDILKKKPGDGAFFVVSKDIYANTITASNKEPEILSLSPKKVVVKDVNWLVEPIGPSLEARIRYRGEKIPIILSLSGKKLAVEFTKPVRGLSLGQSIVFYDGELCLGGAVLDKVA